MLSKQDKTLLKNIANKIIHTYVKNTNNWKVSPILTYAKSILSTNSIILKRGIKTYLLQEIKRQFSIIYERHSNRDFQYIEQRIIEHAHDTLAKRIGERLDIKAWSSHFKICGIYWGEGCQETNGKWGWHKIVYNYLGIKKIENRVYLLTDAEPKIHFCTINLHPFYLNPKTNEYEYKIDNTTYLILKAKGIYVEVSYKGYIERSKKYLTHPQMETPFENKIKEALPLAEKLKKRIERYIKRNK